MKQQYSIAGWLAMANAALSIPLAVIGFLTMGEDGRTRVTDMATDVFVVLGLFMMVYLLITLRELLHRRYRFHQVDLYIPVMIAIGAVSTGATIAARFMTDLGLMIMFVGLLLMICYSVATVIFGFKILGMEGGLMGLKKPFCHLTIAYGLSLSFFHFLPVVVILGAAANVVLGMIFFRAARSDGPLE